MSNGLKLLLIASGTIITLIVVTISLSLAKGSKRISQSYNQGINAVYESIDNSEIVMYDGVEVYGSDVVNFIKKQLSEFETSEIGPLAITVITSNTPLKSNTYYNSTYIEDIQNFTKDNYIKPLNKFKGKVIKNQNGVIIEVVFTIQ